jgi:hypothetical protein
MWVTLSTYKHPPTALRSVVRGPDREEMSHAEQQRKQRRSSFSASLLLCVRSIQRLNPNGWCRITPDGRHPVIIHPAPVAG